MTQIRLALGAGLLLLLVGGGLIYLIYGREAAILGVTCLLAGIGLFGLIWLILWAMEKLVEQNR